MPTEKGQRGQLTSRIKEKSLELLGYEITQDELRLMPYISYVMQNNQRIDPIRINNEEREILQRWRNAGYIEGGISALAITKQFWNHIQELIFLGYVDIIHK